MREQPVYDVCLVPSAEFNPQKVSERELHLLSSFFGEILKEMLKADIQDKE